MVRAARSALSNLGGVGVLAFVVIAACTVGPDWAEPALVAGLVAKGWRRTAWSKGVVLQRGHHSSAVQIGKGAILIGSLFDAEGVPVTGEALKPLLARPDVDPVSALLDRYWGRYVLIRLDPEGQPIRAFADPSGGLGAVTWRVSGRRVIASEPTIEVLSTFTPDLTIDRAVLAGFMADASSLSSRSALKGVRLIPPGAEVDLTGAGEATQIWQAADYAAQPITNRRVAETRLREAVFGAVRGLADGRTILAEVSGGLDSSIIAGALCEARAEVRVWLNLAIDKGAGDERPYARALAAHLRVPLTEIAQAPLVFDPQDQSVVQTGFAPSFNGLDAGYDLDLLRVGEAAGIEAIMTGLAGDTVFFSSHTALAMQDHVRRLGWRAWTTPFLGDLARWTRRSAYELIKLGLTTEPKAPIYPMVLPDWFICDGVTSSHPWLERASDLAPAKHLQLQSLTHQLASIGRSRRGQRFDILYPLLTQPVMQAALAIPIDLLVEGGRDRALARRAFTTILPPMIVERRSKGDASYRFAAALAKGLAALRPFLLEGRLAAMGLIDPSRLEAALVESELAQQGGSTLPMRVAALESWVRYWEGIAAALRGGATSDTDPATP